jgi:hypothetical protein
MGAIETGIGGYIGAKKVAKDNRDDILENLYE